MYRCPSAFELLVNTEHEVLHGREEQVFQLIKHSEFIPPNRAKAEVSYFFRSLGVDAYYFQSTTDEQIAEHILALYSAKLLSATSQLGTLSLRLFQEKEDSALYIVPSLSGQPNSPSVKVEHRIESEYLLEGYLNRDINKKILGDWESKLPYEISKEGYRVQVYRTSGYISPASETKLRLYFVQKANFTHPPPPATPLDHHEDDNEFSKETSLSLIADQTFLNVSTDNTKRLTEEILKEAVHSLGSVTRVLDEVEPSNPNEVRLMVAYRSQSTHSFFSGMTALYHSHGLQSTKKYFEPMSNGMRVLTFFLRESPHHPIADNASLLERARRVQEESSYIYVLPRTSLSDLFYPCGLTAPELAYTYALWKFAHQFLNSFNDEEVLTFNSSISSSENSKLKGVFSKMRQSIKRDVMTEDRVKDVVYDYLDIVKLLFQNFDKTFNPKQMKVGNREDDEHLTTLIKKSASSDLDFRILNSFIIFNRAVLKTNFYKSTKVALSFKLDPSLFLSKLDYPVTPYALFFVVGAEFRGFHLRFVDIARGGIRIIRSANTSSFAINVSTLFDENYNLAFTQQKKNKDIPEGGSKGTILLSLDHQDKSFVAFKKYIDALLDLLLVPSPDIVDFYNKDEILFLGPDEGTAEYMNWASTHAHKRGYAFWKSFTTGKSRSLGGIPHDLYGMTTRSIHQFVLGILRKLNLDEADIKKFQTGGPDGDLGSNEIKISKDKTIAVVDGSGVLYDPNGIDRVELTRLADHRLMSNHFDRSKLGAGGFFVDINDIDVTLPNGLFIEKGLLFRNNFHLESTLLDMVDLFVPCGGRPAAVNISNVHLLYDTEVKKPRFKYIVEGANLFFTQEARLQLESWGVILFKDASANKGGVTSSSLEVLAALALSDQEFKQHMQVLDDANPPSFYTEYVLEVQRIIEEHARDEFECLWRESSSPSSTPRCELTDVLSEKINTLNDQISRSQLWDNDSLKKRVITLAIPHNLVELLGIDTIMRRVPESYLKAIFGAYLAARFVYSRGLHAGEFGFFEFMTEFLS